MPITADEARARAAARQKASQATAGPGPSNMQVFPRVVATTNTSVRQSVTVPQEGMQLMTNVFGSMASGKVRTVYCEHCTELATCTYTIFLGCYDTFRRRCNSAHH